MYLTNVKVPCMYLNVFFFILEGERLYSVHLTMLVFVHNMAKTWKQIFLELNSIEERYSKLPKTVLSHCPPVKFVIFEKYYCHLWPSCIAKNVWFRFMYSQKLNCSASLFPKRKYNVLSLNFCIHVYVSDLYITWIGPPIFLQQNMQTDPGNI